MLFLLLIVWKHLSLCPPQNDILFISFAYFVFLITHEGRPGVADVYLLSGLSGLAFDSSIFSLVLQPNPVALSVWSSFYLFSCPSAKPCGSFCLVLFLSFLLSFSQTLWLFLSGPLSIFSLVLQPNPVALSVWSSFYLFSCPSTKPCGSFCLVLFLSFLLSFNQTLWLFLSGPLSIFSLVLQPNPVALSVWSSFYLFSCPSTKPCGSFCLVLFLSFLLSFNQTLWLFLSGPLSIFSLVLQPNPVALSVWSSFYLFSCPSTKPCGSFCLVLFLSFLLSFNQTLWLFLSGPLSIFSLVLQPNPVALSVWSSFYLFSCPSTKPCGSFCLVLFLSFLLSFNQTLWLFLSGPLSIFSLVLQPNPVALSVWSSFYLFSCPSTKPCGSFCLVLFLSFLLSFNQTLWLFLSGPLSIFSLVLQPNPVALSVWSSFYLFSCPSTKPCGSFCLVLFLSFLLSFNQTLWLFLSGPLSVFSLVLQPNPVALSVWSSFCLFSCPSTKPCGSFCLVLFLSFLLSFNQTLWLFLSGPLSVFSLVLQPNPVALSVWSSFCLFSCPSTKPCGSFCLVLFLSFLLSFNQTLWLFLSGPLSVFSLVLQPNPVALSVWSSFCLFSCPSTKPCGSFCLVLFLSFLLSFNQTLWLFLSGPLSIFSLVLQPNPVALSVWSSFYLFSCPSTKPCGSFCLVLFLSFLLSFNQTLWLFLSGPLSIFSLVLQPNPVALSVWSSFYLSCPSTKPCGSFCLVLFLSFLLSFNQTLWLFLSGPLSIFSLVLQPNPVALSVWSLVWLLLSS